MSKGASHLFKLANFGGHEAEVGMKHFSGASDNLDTSAPICIPVGASPSSFMRHDSIDASLIQKIDVVNGFDWTLTPPHARSYSMTGDGINDIPYIRMAEYKQNFNSLIQNLKYLLNSGVDALQPVLNTISTVAKNATKSAEAQGAIKEGVKATDEIGQSIANLLKIDYGQVKEDFTRFIKNQRFDHKGIPYYLRAYNGLYGVRPSGFEYYLPYFTADWKTVRSSWGDIQGGSALGTLLNLPQQIAGGIIETAGLTRTGAYFERPKSYELPVEGESITFKFPLYNTRDFEQVKRNFEFVFLLTYQQMANKTSKVLLDPPVIYEIEVPGQFYSPYAYIANLSIQGLGAKRRETIPFLNEFDDTSGQEDEGGLGRPKFNGAKSDSDAKNAQPGKVCSIDGASNGGKSTEVEAIIPEMWDITITLQSLVPQTKNLFYHSIAGSKNLFDVKIQGGGGEFTQQPVYGPQNQPAGFGSFGVLRGDSN